MHHVVSRRLKQTQRPKLLEQPSRAPELQRGHMRDQKEEAASAAAQKVTYLVCMDAKITKAMVEMERKRFY